MHTIFARGLLIIFTAAVMVGCTSEKSAEKKSQDQQAPQTDAGFIEQATFTSLEGDSVSLSKYEGKVVLIDFWETWCRPCLASFPTLQKLQDEYPEKFVVLAVTPGFVDNKEDAESFVNKNDYSFEFLMDSNNLHKKLNIMSIPHKIYVDAEGNFIKQSRGTSGPDGDYQQAKKIIEKHKKS